MTEANTKINFIAPLQFKLKYILLFLFEFGNLKSRAILTSGSILNGSSRNISFSTETDASTHYIYSSNQKKTVLRLW